MRPNRVPGTGVGQGHEGHTPHLPPILPMALPPRLEQMRRVGQLQFDTKAFAMGEVNILRSFDEVRGWHLSLSHSERYPTWDEVAQARYQLIPNEIMMAMLLPPREQYINLHNYVFHLIEVVPK